MASFTYRISYCTGSTQPAVGMRTYKKVGTDPQLIRRYRRYQQCPNPNSSPSPSPNLNPDPGPIPNRNPNPKSREFRDPPPYMACPSIPDSGAS